jgi:hypothetical protein
VVFVHGFAGDPLGTWVGFPQRLPTKSACRGHDLFFYGYDGVRKGATFSAAILREFLETLLSAPGSLAEGSAGAAQRPTDAFAYDTIVLAAHSLGAVVVRRALLDVAQGHHAKRTSAVRLVLYAPAHRGGTIIPLAQQALGVLRVVPVAALAKSWARVLVDLEPGSDALETLKADTEAALARATADGAAVTHLVAACVLHGEDDSIVGQVGFCQDPPMTPVRGADHFEVCKPTDDRPQPLDHLLSHL